MTDAADPDHDPERWFASWREGRIGFHEGTPNALLARHAAQLTGRRVLVPLCGKTEDLAYLAAAGHEVVGIELVEDAARAFFDEHALVPTVTRRGALAVYTAGAITVVVGDVFAVTAEDLVAIDAIYDRAALIALPPALRPRYVDHLRMLVPPATPGLLITLEYPPGALAGPPYAVGDAEVRALYATATLLEEGPASGRRFADAAFATTERCYAVTL